MAEGRIIYLTTDTSQASDFDDRVFHPSNLVGRKCWQRARDRLSWVSNKCCRVPPYCHCISDLCVSSPNNESNGCLYERTKTCDTGREKKCPKMTDSTFPEKCPKVQMDSLVGEDRSRKVSQHLVARWIVIFGGLIILLGLIALLLWLCRRYKNKVKHNFDKRRKSSKRSAKNRRVGTDGATLDRGKTRSGKTRHSTKPSLALPRGGKPSGQRLGSKNQRTPTRMRSPTKQQQAKAAPVRTGPVRTAPVRTGPVRTPGSQVKQGLSNTARSGGKGSKCKIAVEKLIAPSRSFNSRAINTVEMPANMKDNQRAPITYSKFRKALQ